MYFVLFSFRAMNNFLCLSVAFLARVFFLASLSFLIISRTSSFVQGFKVDYNWLRSTMKHILRDDGVLDGWNDKSFSNKWVRKYCRRWRISKQRKRNNKEKSDAERVHQCKNHHSFQIYIAPLMLPEDVDIISSDDENILLMLPSNERKEFRKALRKEIRERER